MDQGQASGLKSPPLGPRRGPEEEFEPTEDLVPEHRTRKHNQTTTRDDRRILDGQLSAPGGVPRRLFREGKAVISGELTGVFERLGSNAENWQARLHKLAPSRLLGRFFAASRARLREVAGRLGVHHLANLGGCAERSRRPEGWIPISSPFHSSGDGRKILAILS
jgi:hypothetical protein